MQKTFSLKSWRENLGLTQEKAAQRLSITQPSYSRYETKKAKPSPQQTLKLEKLTGIPKEYLRPDFYQPDSNAHA